MNRLPLGCDKQGRYTDHIDVEAYDVPLRPGEVVVDCALTIALVVLLALVVSGIL